MLSIFFCLFISNDTQEKYSYKQCYIAHESVHYSFEKNIFFSCSYFFPFISANLLWNWNIFHYFNCHMLKR